MLFVKHLLGSGSLECTIPLTPHNKNAKSAHRETEGCNIFPRPWIKYVVESRFDSKSNIKSNTCFSRSSCCLSFHVALKLEEACAFSLLLRNPKQVATSSQNPVPLPPAGRSRTGVKLKKEGAWLLPNGVRTGCEVTVLFPRTGSPNQTWPWISVAFQVFWLWCKSRDFFFTLKNWGEIYIT